MSDKMAQALRMLSDHGLAPDAEPARQSLRMNLNDAKGQNPVPVEEFSHAMAHLAASVCIVTAGRGEGRVGRTVTSLMSLSAHPPSLVTAIATGSPLAEQIVSEGGFAVTMLAAGQDGIGNAFAGAVPPAERFAEPAWQDWPSGRPRLEGALANLDCALIGTMTLESHHLFIGGLTKTQTHQRAPLIWHQRGYRGAFDPEAS